MNFTLPDEKSNYVHRIGRVGRAERMGLAISLVATVPEKVNQVSLSLYRADTNEQPNVFRCGTTDNGAVHVERTVGTQI